MSALPKNESGETIYDFLDVFRQRPGMYLGAPELVRLYSFLAGYELALAQQGLAFRASSPNFGSFRDWIAVRLRDDGSTAGWYDMIRTHSASEREALVRFYELLEEFKACGGVVAAS